MGTKERKEREKEVRKKTILEAAKTVFFQKGFQGTTMDQIAEVAELSKGSLYLYFPSKEEFGLAVIDRFAEGYERYLCSFLLEQRVTPLKRLRNYLNAVAAAVGLEEEGCVRGCLIGNLGQELAAQNETFRLRLEAIFANWLQHLAANLDQARAAGEVGGDLDSQCMAGVLLSGLQGALLRAKVQRSAQPITELTDTLFGRLLV